MSLPLLDHHCHGVVTRDLGRAEFEALLTEGNAAGARGGTLFDSGIGMELRRHCPPVLGLEPFATPEAYLERRAELGWSEVSRRFLSASGLAGVFIDTGLGDPGPLHGSPASPAEPASTPLTTPAELGRLAGAPAGTVIRLESIAQDLAFEQVPAAAFINRVGEAVNQLAADAVATKTIAAYRCGLAELPARQPGRAALASAVSAFLSTARAAREKRNDRPRLTDPTIIRFLIGTAIETGLPLQVHTGFGDADLHLRDADPLHLTPLLRELAPTGVPVLLLHTYPYQRNAGYLAQVFDNVFCDVGLAIPQTGRRGPQILAELLELAPYGKVLYSSDAYGLAELYYLGAVLFRESLGKVLDDLGLPAAEAARIAHLIAQGNAERVYRRIE